MTPADDLPPNAPDPPEPDDADLIAYLDGELDGPAAQAVEARLALDPAARADAEAYRKSFDLLDYLPKSEPSPDFASRTLTRLNLAADPAVAASGSRTGVVAAPPPGRWRAAVAWGLIAAVGLGAGFAAHAAFRPPVAAAPEPLPLSDLSVIERLPLYAGVDDLDFVKALDEPDLFGASAAAPAPPGPSLAPRAELPPGTRDQLIERFRRYPPARQQQLRQLDRQFGELPAADRDRLGRVLDEYAVWLDRLPDADRADVLAAAAPADRLEVVRLTRERAWRDALPVPQKEQLKLVADPEEKLRLVARWKHAEQARRDEWALARRQWDALHHGGSTRPWPFSDPTLTAGVDEYIRTVLRVDPGQKVEPKLDLPQSCRLTREEFLELRSRQDAAAREGYWLLYGACVLKLAERHPGLPEWPDRPPITDFTQLTAETQKDLRFRKIAQEVRRNHLRGKWPEFALELAAAAQKVGTPVPEPLGPSRPAEFGPPVRDFVTGTLLPKLSSSEHEALAKIEGKWPEYPKRVVDLAVRYDLPVPGVTLPGAPSLWAKFYAGSPGRD